MLYYCGFDSFLKFRHKSGINNIFLRPLSDLIFDNSDHVISAYVGWCSLFLQTGSGQVVYLGYSNPKAHIKKQLDTKSNETLNNTNNNHVTDKKHKDSNELIVCEKAPKYIVNIECGSKETMVLTLDHQLFKWTGFNFVDTEPTLIGQLEPEGEPSTPTTTGTSGEQPTQPLPPIEQISVGVEYSCVLTDSGDAILFDISTGRLGARLTDKRCVAVSCGQEHVLALTDTGRVLSYGRGSRGQLGHGDVEDVVGGGGDGREPVGARLVDALDGVKIKAVAAGGWHSMALSTTGDVYVWGWNESGQLGYPRETIAMKALPLPLEISDDDCFASISAGSRHSMAVSENGILFGWGWNKWGQLGLDPKLYVVCDTPQVIPVDEKVKTICCKFWSSLIETEREPTPDD
ncbi:unnamed protein product [Medioppia subpectinata]|uniref:Uncharacterized protein n=1 Tax=Medioppia subpectinata TaxID=1979941 RepID=A0A7R9L0F0_9ACAR|nr:unnamed protein product [Medioppia subpectinata]CAG2112099.1 unnamed protein product [Medioppia subpectinata]